jgi:hypothetical protein
MTKATHDEGERFEPSETMRPTVVSQSETPAPLMDIPAPPPDHSRARTALGMVVGVVGALSLFGIHALIQEMASDTGAVGRAVVQSEAAPAAAPAHGMPEAVPITAWDEPLQPFNAEVAADELSRAAIDAQCVTEGPNEIEVQARFTTEGDVSSVRILAALDKSAAQCLDAAWKKVSITPFEGFPTNVRAKVRVR